MKSFRLSVLSIAILFLWGCNNDRIITLPPRSSGGITMDVTAQISVLEKTSILPSYGSTRETDGIELKSEDYYLKLTNVGENIVAVLLEQGIAVDHSAQCHETYAFIECTIGPYYIQYYLSGDD